jgi:16S rRNA (adenine1518-N6/adenine1519-N6)-dimethyltransferase
VDSAVVKIQPRPDKRAAIVDRSFYHDFVRRLFHHRRKLLRGVVCGMYRKQLEKSQVDDVLTRLQLPAETRAEELEPSQLVTLSNLLHEEIGKSTD